MISIIDQSSKFINSSKGKQKARTLAILESRNNLNLTKLIEKSVEKKSSQYLTIASKLSYESYIILLMSIQKDSITEFISKKVLDDDKDFNTSNLLENIILRIKILQAISELDQNLDLNKIDLKTRLKHLNLKIIELIKILQSNS
jgi:hypothetical protein